MQSCAAVRALTSRLLGPEAATSTRQSRGTFAIDCRMIESMSGGPNSSDFDSGPLLDDIRLVGAGIEFFISPGVVNKAGEGNETSLLETLSAVT